MKTYTITEIDGGNSKGSVTVRAETESAAAVRGATKLGLRWMGRKPSTAQRHGQGSLFVVYGPHDRASNGQHRIGCVRVM